MNKKDRTLLITGANRGLGLGVVESLCQFNTDNLRIIMAGKSPEKNEQIIQNLKNKYPGSKLEFLQVEIGNIESQQQLVNKLKLKNIQIDILVNNAGIFPKSGDNITPNTLSINFFGTVEFTKQMMSILSNDAKILQLSSIFSQISFQLPHVQTFLQKPNLTEEEIFQFAKDYIDEANHNPDLDSQAYHTSKSLLNAWVRWVGVKSLQEKQSMYLVDPGWVKTDMGGPEATDSLDSGIRYAIDIINNFPYERSKNSGELYKYGQYMGF